MVDIPCPIAYAKFGGDRLMCLGVAVGKILPFPIDSDRRPYNSRTIPCECVIDKFMLKSHAMWTEEAETASGVNLDRILRVDG